MASNYASIKTESLLKCDDCLTVNATYWCDVCRMNYCTACCTEVHKRSALVNHQITKTHEEPVEMVHCEIHINQTIKYWCYTCESVACLDCLMFEHKNHTCRLAEKAAPEVSIELRDNLDKVQSSFDHHLKEITHLFRSQEKINMDTISDTFTLLRKVMDEQEETLKQQILEIETKNQTLIIDYQTQLKSKEQYLSEQKKSFDAIIAANDHIKLLKNIELLKTYANEMTKELEEQKPPQKTNYHISGIDGLQTNIDDMIKRVVIVVETPETVETNHSPTSSQAKLRCGGSACLTCKKCSDWKWNDQTKKWNRSSDAKCSWQYLPVGHALFPWHFLCHC